MQVSNLLFAEDIINLIKADIRKMPNGIIMAFLKMILIDSF